MNSQNYNRYGYCWNNPLRFSDPSGEWIHILIGAVVGGIINTAIKASQGKINNWGDGFAAFGIGAVAGAVGTATGGAAFAAVGGAAGGAGGFLAGAAGGAVISAVSMPVQNIGNMIYFNDPLMSAKEYFTGIVIGGLVGGIINGAIAGFNGKNVWTGKNIADGRGMFSFNNSPKYTASNTSYNVEVDGVVREINPKTISETLESFDIKAYKTNPIYKNQVDSYLEKFNNPNLNLNDKSIAIAGHMKNNTLYVTDGHHRVVAATIKGMQTGNYEVLQKLIDNGFSLKTISTTNTTGLNFSNFSTIWK